MKRFTLFAILILSLSLFACDKNDDLIQNSEGGASKNFFLSMGGETNLVFPPAGGVATFSVTAKKQWDIRIVYDSGNNQSWATAVLCSSKGATQEWEIRVSPCTSWKNTETTRTATIKLENVDNPQKEFVTIYAKQHHPYWRLELNDSMLDGTSYEHSYQWYNCKENATEPGSIKLAVESNVYWKVVDLPTWLSCDVTEFVPTFNFDNGEFKSELTNNLKFIPETYNVSSKDLTKDIKIRFGEKDLGTTKDYTLKMSQGHLIFDVTSDMNNPTVSNDGYDVEFAPCNNSSDIYKFEITASRSWKIADKPNWITCDVESGDGNENPITFSPQGVNSSESELSYYIKLLCNIDEDYSDDQLPYRTVKVLQRGYVLESTSQNLSFNNAGEGSQKFTIRSSGAWSVVPPTDASWLLVEGAAFSGVGHEYLEGGASEDTSFDCKITGTDCRNYSEKPNMATITLKSTEPNVFLEKHIEVVQDAYQLGANGFPSALIGANEKTYNINITSTGEWEIKSDANWVDFSSNSGKDSGAIICTVSKNTTSSDRKATITLISKTHADVGKSLEKTYEITQQKFVFNVDTTPLTFGPINATGQKVKIECSAGWSISSSESWAHVSPELGGSTGTSSTEVVVSVDDYLLDSKSRSCTLTISNDFDTSNTKTINITQNKFEFSAKLASGQLANVSAAATTENYSDMERTFDVESSSSDWGIAAGTGYSVSHDQKRVTFSYNPESTSRTLIVNIHPIYNGTLYTSISRSISFIQSGLEFDKSDKSITVESPVMSEANAELAKDAFLNSFKSSGVCIVRYIDGADSWLKLVDSNNNEVADGATVSGDLIDYKVQVKSDNRSSKSRTGEIQICLHQSRNASNGTYAVYKSINVTQNGESIVPTRVGGVGECSLLQFAKSEGTQKVIVNSNFGWIASIVTDDGSTADWVTITPNSGNGGESFDVKVDANNTSSDRWVRLYVESEHYAATKEAELRKEITVSQSSK